LLAAALRSVDALRRQAVETSKQDRRDHPQGLERIPEDAIDKHQDGGAICRGGVKGVLTEFGPAEDEPRPRGGSTSRGSYEVGTTDEYDARDGAEKLGVDLSAVYEADTDTARHEVEIVEVQTIGH